MHHFHPLSGYQKSGQIELARPSFRRSTLEDPRLSRVRLDPRSFGFRDRYESRQCQAESFYSAMSPKMITDFTVVFFSNQLNPLSFFLTRNGVCTNKNSNGDKSPAR